MIWRGNDLRISKQLTKPIINDIAVNWKLVRSLNLIGSKLFKVCI